MKNIQWVGFVHKRLEGGPLQARQVRVQGSSLQVYGKRFGVMGQAASSTCTVLRHVNIQACTRRSYNLLFFIRIHLIFYVVFK